MEPAIESAVAWPESTNADELPGLDKVSFKDVLGDRLVKDVELGLGFPFVDDRELAWNPSARPALAVRMAGKGFPFGLILFDAKPDRIGDEDPSGEMLGPCRVALAGDFLPQVLSAFHERVFERHGWDEHLARLAVIVLMLAPVAGIVIGVRFFFQLWHVRRVLAGLAVWAGACQCYCCFFHMCFVLVACA